MCLITGNIQIQQSLNTVKDEKLGMIRLLITTSKLDINSAILRSKLNVIYI